MDFPAVRLDHKRGDCGNPPVRSVLVSQTELLLIVTDRVIKIGSGIGHGAIPIFGVQERCPGLELVRQFLFSIAKLSFPFPGEAHLIRVGIPIPQPGIGCDQGLLELFLRCL